MRLICIRIKVVDIYWVTENLIKEGYDATVFCANIYHNKSEFIDTGKEKHATDILNGILFIFVKTTTALANGLDRVKDMSLFSFNLFSVAKEYAKLNEKYDVIFAFSIKLSTMIEGIKVAKKLCILLHIRSARFMFGSHFVFNKSIKQKLFMMRI